MLNWEDALFERAELPYFVGRGEVHEILLPNNEVVRVPGRFVEAVFPLLVGETPFRQEQASETGLRLHMPEVAPHVLGTAFVIGADYGTFLTVAHNLPEDYEELIEERRLAGFFVDGPQSFHLLPVTSVVVNRERDVAVGTCAALAGGHATLPLDFGEGWPNPHDVLMTAGYPLTDRDEGMLHFYPDVFVGRGWERREQAAQVSHRGQSIVVEGPFVGARIRLRPGHSGGPLLAYWKTADSWRGHVVGMLSWVHEPDPVESTFNEAHFVSVSPALDLQLPFMGGMSLREVARLNSASRQDPTA